MSLLTGVDSVLKSGADFLFQVSTTTTVTSQKFHLMPAMMVKIDGNTNNPNYRRDFCYVLLTPMETLKPSYSS